MRPSIGRIVVVASLCAGTLSAEPVAVRRAEGVLHGFLVLSDAQGNAIADGDLVQFGRGDHIVSRMTFRFHDGSLHDETVEFSQRGRFRMVSDHLVQKGPSFPRPMDVLIDGRSGRVTVHSWDKDGKETVTEETVRLPADAANGLPLTLVKNLARGASATVSMVAATPKPMIVKLLVAPAGEDTFWIGRSQRKATRYVAKVDIGGIKGILADLLGKTPPDTYVWVLPGDAPAFVKSEGPIYFGGPVWRIELASPAWKHASRTAEPKGTNETSAAGERADR